MAMRMTGMMSGLDTESIIQQLVEAKSVKVKTAKKAQTKLEWKQDAWKGLNTKLKNLQNKYLSNMRFISSYSKKVTTVSNSSAVSVITGTKAVNGVQTLEIKHQAKTGYLTGGEISSADGKKLTALSKISDINPDFVGEGSINIKAGNKSVDVKITGDTTISDVLNQLKDAGLNASFDAKNQRFFVSAKESGAANDFSITALDANGASALSALGLQTSLDGDAASKAEYETYSKYYVAGDRDATLANMQSMIDKDVAARKNSYLSQYKTLQKSLNAAQKKIDDINQKYAEDSKTLKSVDEYQTLLDEKNAQIQELEEQLKAEDLSDERKQELEEQLTALKEDVSGLKAEKADAETIAKQNETISNLEKQIADVKQYVDITETKDEDGNVIGYEAAATDKLTQEVEDRYYNRAEYASKVMSGEITLSGGATKIDGQDAEIYLNGARFVSSNNTFEINGLTITVQDEPKSEDETLKMTLTTADDTDGIYDMIKDFLKEYNSIINEMDKLFNADSAKGYEPLTDEEKDVMSESEIEKYEQKIKDALLRRDSNLNSVSSALKEVMSRGVTVNGKTMYLSNFGINTLGYFNSADNEKNAYHIDGDPDDGSTSGNADILKSMIANDPDTVINFFSQLSKDLYAKMDDLSRSQQGYRSFGNFFDDVKMKSDYDDYTKKIAELEEKLNAYEDKWYKKFSKMETAMSKMQSNMSAVTALLGG